MSFETLPFTVSVCDTCQSPQVHPKGDPDLIQCVTCNELNLRVFWFRCVNCHEFEHNHTDARLCLFSPTSFRPNAPPFTVTLWEDGLRRWG